MIEEKHAFFTYSMVGIILKENVLGVFETASTNRIVRILERGVFYTSETSCEQFEELSREARKNEDSKDFYTDKSKEKKKVKIVFFSRKNNSFCERVPESNIFPKPY